MIDPQVLLATMISLTPPGNSVYSQVEISQCDTKCQETSACDNPTDWRCSKPKFSHARYQKNLERLVQDGVSYDVAMTIAREKSFTRPETYNEGVIRYWVIANAASKVAHETTNSVCKSACSGGDRRCYKRCDSAAPWRGTEKQLAYMLIVVANGESGFRRDVHLGLGHMSRGDCVVKNNKRFCQSACLTQINIGNGKTPEGWSASDLVGTDQKSTSRCFATSAKYLAKSRGWCTGPYMPVYKDWAKATFAAYGSGNSCVLYARNKHGEPIFLKDKMGNILLDSGGKKRRVEKRFPAIRAHQFWSHIKHPRQLGQKELSILFSTESANIEATATGNEEGL